MNHTQVDRAVGLLFPQEGRHARDVKFFITSGATEEKLAEQVVICFAAMADPSTLVTSVDQGLTS